MGMLDGKVAFITGGARGQGRSHAITCARQGADVVVFDIAAQMATVSYEMAQPGDLEETVLEVEAQGARALAIEGDVRSQADLDGAVSRGLEELGGIDILIANAGIWTTAPFWEMPDEQWEETIGVNLTGIWKAAKAVTPYMIERKAGSMVLVSSINGLEPGKAYAHYTASKHGVIGLMKTIALELAPYGIRCNAICPGAIQTPMADHQGAWDMFAGREGGTQDDMLRGGYHFAALRGTTFMSPKVVADTALYLNSDLARTVTGVTVPVDGGHLLLEGYNHTPVS